MFFSFSDAKQTLALLSSELRREADELGFSRKAKETGAIAAAALHMQGAARSLRGDKLLYLPAINSATMSGTHLDKCASAAVD